MPPATAADAELRTSFVAAAQSAISEIGFREPWGWKDPRVCSARRSLAGGGRRISGSSCPFGTRSRSCCRCRRRGSCSVQLGLSLWLTYYTELLARVPPSDRVVVSYDAFLDDPAGSVERLVDRLGLGADAAQREQAAASVKVGLRHHASDAGNLAGMPDAGRRSLQRSACRGAGWRARRASARPAAEARAFPKRWRRALKLVVADARDALRGHVERSREEARHLETGTSGGETLSIGARRPRAWSPSRSGGSASAFERRASGTRGGRGGLSRRPFKARLRPLIFRTRNREFHRP